MGRETAGELRRWRGPLAAGLLALILFLSGAVVNLARLHVRLLGKPAEPGVQVLPLQVAEGDGFPLAEVVRPHAGDQYAEAGSLQHLGFLQELTPVGLVAVLQHDRRTVAGRQIPAHQPEAVGAGDRHLQVG